MQQRIIVFSDSHNYVDTLCEIVNRHPKADCFLHLGDGARDVEDLRIWFPDKQILAVRGNCDYGTDEAYERTLDVGATRIFFTHGHTYGVKQGGDRILAKARELSADIACFGHTHQSLCVYQDGIHLLNPGSTGLPRNGIASYGMIDLTQAGIVVRVVPL